MLRQLCQWKGVEIVEGEICPDHIRLPISIPPQMSVSGFMGYLKGKSSLMIFQKYGNLKIAYRNREFWCRGYYVDTTGKNTAAIKAYKQNRLKVDKAIYATSQTMCSIVQNEHMLMGSCCCRCFFFHQRDATLYNQGPSFLRLSPAEKSLCCGLFRFPAHELLLGQSPRSGHV